MVEHLGPRMEAALREKLPLLEGETRSEVEWLMIQRSADPAAEIVRRLEDPTTPLDQFNRIQWEARLLDNPEQTHLAVSRFVSERVLPSNSKEVVTARQLMYAIELMSESHDRKVVARMIDLLEADFKAWVGDYATELEFKNLIAGRLVEMTGESFGLSATEWRKWFSTEQPDSGSVERDTLSR